MDLRFSGVETTVAQVDGGCVGNGCEAQEQSEGTGAEAAGSAADEVLELRGGEQANEFRATGKLLGKTAGYPAGGRK